MILTDVPPPEEIVVAAAESETEILVAERDD
jgi:hypothetical protein